MRACKNHRPNQHGGVVQVTPEPRFGGAPNREPGCSSDCAANCGWGVPKPRPRWPETDPEPRLGNTHTAVLARLESAFATAVQISPNRPNRTGVRFKRRPNCGSVAALTAARGIFQTGGESRLHARWTAVYCGSGPAKSRFDCRRTAVRPGSAEPRFKPTFDHHRRMAISGAARSDCGYYYGSSS